MKRKVLTAIVLTAAFDEHQYPSAGASWRCGLQHEAACGAEKCGRHPVPLD
jgi:hypothetical protein